MGPLFTSAWNPQPRGSPLPGNFHSSLRAAQIEAGQPGICSCQPPDSAEVCKTILPTLKPDDHSCPAKYVIRQCTHVTTDVLPLNNQTKAQRKTDKWLGTTVSTREQQTRGVSKAAGVCWENQHKNPNPPKTKFSDGVSGQGRKRNDTLTRTEK